MGLDADKAMKEEETMFLSKIRFKNYRLIVDAELNVDNEITLIVGRNNTAKTSCISFIEKVLTNKPLSYNDYPIQRRKYAYTLLAQFIRGKISYDQLCEKLPTASIEFVIDYSFDDMDTDLGALSPFIIDVDADTTVALIRAEYKMKIGEESLRTLFHSCFYKDEKFTYDQQSNYRDAREICINQFPKMFELTIYAVNPKDKKDVQIKKVSNLTDLMPFYPIYAERELDETGGRKKGSLSSLISNYFSMDIEKVNPKISTEVAELRETVEAANKEMQRQSSDMLSSIVNKAVGFGYPNGEELQLGVNTKLQIDNQLTDKTELTYISNIFGESLPDSYNGLGYKNLIKIEFQLAEFAEEIKQSGSACIPLLFIEEPESHMHPQMQQTFGSYLESFLEQISEVRIQTFLTSHSAHIANTFDFSRIRYAQKRKKGVVYKDLNVFCKENPANLNFIKKYLTLSKCDLFFADKVIFVEGASERLLLPDMIRKCDEKKLFESQKYKLSAQYYTLIEIGGAYAYKFISFVEFLGIPCLILTDIDSMLDGRTKSTVNNGQTTSNPTLKWWLRKVKSLSDDEKVILSDIVALTPEQRTIEKSHIEFQVKENGLCGRSLEEAIKNVNRMHYGISCTATEADLEFDEKSKTDFALNLICENPDYNIPKYIMNGLIWLNDQKILE